MGLRRPLPIGLKEKILDTRIWKIQNEKEIERLYMEAGSVVWLQNAIKHLLLCIEEIKKSFGKN